MPLPGPELLARGRLARSQSLYQLRYPVHRSYYNARLRIHSYTCRSWEE
jgi:hypothetical protein